MKKTFACTALAALLVGSTAHGAAYRIPEQSVNAVAKAGANIASSNTADASYFNPANMSWLEDRALFEGAAEWIHLKTINYHDNRSPLYSGESDGEDFVLPQKGLVLDEIANQIEDGAVEDGIGHLDGLIAEGLGNEALSDTRWAE